MTHFTQTHHAQNPVNIELLNFVNQRGTAAWRDLFNAFGEGPVDSKAARHRFGKKLEYLVYTGRLQASGKGRTRTFSIGPDAHDAVPARGRTNSPSGQCSAVAVLVDVLQPQSAALCRPLGTAAPIRRDERPGLHPCAASAHSPWCLGLQAL